MQTALENSKRAMKEAADEIEKLKFQIEDAASALEKIDQNSENAAERQEALKTRIKDLNVELEKKRRPNTKAAYQHLKMAGQYKQGAERTQRYAGRACSKCKIS